MVVHVSFIHCTPIAADQAGTMNTKAEVPLFSRQEVAKTFQHQI